MKLNRKLKLGNGNVDTKDIIVICQISIGMLEIFSHLLKYGSFHFQLGHGYFYYYFLMIVTTLIANGASASHFVVIIFMYFFYLLFSSMAFKDLLSGC